MPAPTGPQFQTVFHSSVSQTPPHLVTPNRDDIEGYDNAHPDVIHAGTRQAALDITGIHGNRDFIHAYQVPAEHTYPVTFGDEQYLQNEPDKRNKRDARVVSTGEQEGLFETLTGDPELALRTNMAVPYRNMGEDVGSISYMLPKSAINEGKIRYVGVKNRYDD